MSEAEMRERVVKLAFGGDERQLEEFCDIVLGAIPEGTTVVLRGSSVTGERYDDGAPFDADGPGTSDLDLTLRRLGNPRRVHPRRLLPARRPHQALER